MLLYALWMLTVAAALMALLSSQAIRQSRNLAAFEQSLLRRVVIESAVHAAAASALGRSDEPLTPELLSRPMALATRDGVNVSLTANDGLVDLNHVELGRLIRLLAFAGVANTGPAARMLVARRPLRDYAELATLPGVTARAFACLLPLVTLYSGRSQPDAVLASEAVRTAIALSREDASREGATVTPSVSDNILRIAALPAGSVPQDRLLVDVHLGSSVQRPVAFRAWTWAEPESLSAQGCTAQPEPR